MADFPDYDQFFFHLAQLNIDECQRIVSGLNTNCYDVQALQQLLEWEKQYYLYQYANDGNKQNSIRAEYQKVEILYKDEVGEQLSGWEEDIVQLISIRMSMITIYTHFGDTTIEALDSLFQQLENFQTYEIIPLSESIQFEINSLKNMIQAKRSMTEYNYLKTIIFLTQARQQVKSWESVIIGKKYSPHHENNTSYQSNNNIYRFILRFLTSLIAK